MMLELLTLTPTSSQAHPHSPPLSSHLTSHARPLRSDLTSHSPPLGSHSPPLNSQLITHTKIHSTHSAPAPAPLPPACCFKNVSTSPTFGRIHLLVPACFVCVPFWGSPHALHILGRCAGLGRAAGGGGWGCMRDWDGPAWNGRAAAKGFRATGTWVSWLKPDRRETRLDTL